MQRKDHNWVERGIYFIGHVLLGQINWISNQEFYIKLVMDSNHRGILSHATLTNNISFSLLSFNT